MEANGCLDGTQEKHSKNLLNYGMINFGNITLMTSGWCVIKAEAHMELHSFHDDSAECFTFSANI